MVFTLLILLTAGSLFLGARRRGNIVVSNIVLGIASLLISTFIVGRFLSKMIANLFPGNDLASLVALGVATIILTCLIFIVMSRQVKKMKPKELKNTTLDADLMDQQNNPHNH